ncbi:DUF2878 domain-containing protein [Pseudoteredinibacter isoporae]|uniref:DUF2878 domain-containing protein n=1 Tax=Pseudoteredinibacter isoporae TaxID=570281 RepID=UPI0031073E53
MSASHNPAFLLINFAGFQLSWWTLVVFGDSAIPLALTLLALHFAVVPNKPLEFRIVAGTALTGIAIDGLLSLSSVWVFPETVLPLWLAVLWLCFSATLRHSLRPLWQYPRVLPMLGAVGGSSSYLAAHALGAVSLGFNLLSTTLLCVFLWFLIFPLGIKYCQYCERDSGTHDH